MKRFLQNLGNVSCKINNKSISEISKALSLSKFWMTIRMWLRIHSLAWYQSGWVHRCLYTQETIQSEYCAIPLIHRFIVHSEMISWILYCIRYLRNSCTGSFSAIRILYTANRRSNLLNLVERSFYRIGSIIRIRYRYSSILKIPAADPDPRHSQNYCKRPGIRGESE